MANKLYEAYQTVLIPSQLNSSLTLSPQSTIKGGAGLSLGQLLVANIQPSNGNEVKITIGNQTFTAQTKTPITESGKVQVRVNQISPETQLSIVKNPAVADKGQAIQQIIQAAYRQFIPTQTTISQTFQQFNLMQSLPPSIQSPLQGLINQLAKQDTTTNAKGVKELFSNSGLFFESKIKQGLNQNQAPNINKDIKGQLLNLQQQVERVQLSDPQNKSLSSLSQLLNQAISRITVQQIQLYENPYVTAIQLPNERNQAAHDDHIEIRKSKDPNDDYWEVFVDISLVQGSFSAKLKLNEHNELNAYFWCENQVLQTLIEPKLEKLKQNLATQGFEKIALTLTPQKPSKTEHSIKVALIDIKV